MAQTVNLAVGNTAATGSPIVIAPGGAAVQVTLYTTAGPIPPQSVANLYLGTPGARVLLTQLTSGAPNTVISGPGTYTVDRQEGQTFGVSLEQ